MAPVQLLPSTTTLAEPHWLGSWAWVAQGLSVLGSQTQVKPSLCLTEQDREECFAFHLQHTVLQCSPGTAGIKNTGVESFLPTTYHNYPCPSPFFLLPLFLFIFYFHFFVFVLIKDKGLQTVSTFLSCTSCSEQRSHPWGSNTRQPSGKQSILCSFQCLFSNKRHKILVTANPRILNASAATAR